MENAKNNKNVIIIIVIIIVIIGACYMYATRDRTPDDLLVGVPAGAGITVDTDLISALSALRKLRLDDTIFKKKSWLSMQDFGRILDPQPWGRPNPFAPLPGEETKAQ